jgi:DNA-binding CsgD family transcriptional regulator
MNITTLTARERVVLGLLCEGLTPQEISEREFVSLHTVRTQIRGIFMKTQTNTMHGAVAWAFQRELVGVANKVGA